jgi:serine/threonine protein kinase
LLVKASLSGGLGEGCICSSHAQLPGSGSPLACPSSSQHASQQQLQQHRNSNNSCGAAAGANWALAACSRAAPSQSLGWNAASAFFGKYRLGELMGHGSFGSVHRAVHLQTGNSYAVKVLRKSCSTRGTQLEAIRREVEAWQQAQGSKYVAKLEGLFEVSERAARSA